VNQSADKPLVSIIIPVYNGARYVSEAIESALAQDYPNVEILVINDGSTDEGRTKGAVAPYLDRVRYFEKANGGVASALNLGIREMRGEYISWLSHDDLYRPDKISRQMARMAELGDDVILYTDFEVIDENARKLSSVRVPSGDPHNFRYVLTLHNYLHGCSLLIPRRCIEAVGSFDETLRTTQDYDLWFRLAARYSFWHMPEPLIFSRHHADQGTLRMQDTVLRECNDLIKDFLGRLTDDELKRGSGRSTMGGYVDLARSLRIRRFRGALWASVGRTFKAAGSEAPSTAVFEFLRLGSVLLIEPVFELPRRLGAAATRRLGGGVRSFYRRITS
jgi:glycosyltransferase involved in cell wall biosynthesis